MLNKISVKMLYILLVCPVLLVSAVLTLTIDSQLGTSVEDCFERISIGEQLPNDAIYRNISELTTKECEQICKQDKQCQSYDYGVGAKGNATCNLGNINEKEIKEKGNLRRHPDYDVYVRRFQCEQSPPTPIQAEFDDPDGLLHRPTFKPVMDSKKPLSDELPDDLGSYGNSKPGYNSDRPDDYDNSKPDINNSPSYGDYKPQNVPYPSEKPQNNYPNKRPDPYDVLQLQDPYEKPRPQNNWRPEEMYGHRPVGPDPYQPAMPEYQYFIRPNRKPHKRPLSRPEFDGGYGNKPDHSNKPDPYGQSDQPNTDLPYKPTRPSNGLSSKPYEKPSYNYNSQYASNYGSNDNSIYVEIYDPPRPYKPPRKPSYGLDHGDYDYGHLGYGYDTYSSQNSYSHSQSSQSQYYGSSTLAQGSYNRPNHDSAYRPNHDSAYQPTRPHVNQDSGYGQQSAQKPSEPNKKPYGGGYDQEVTEGYGGSGGGGYGSNSYFSSSQSYGGSASYENSSQSYYGSAQPTKKKPLSSNQGYGSSSQGDEGSYGGTNQVLNNKPYGSSQGYGSLSQSAYGGDQSSYSSSQSSNKPYGSSQEYGGTGQSHQGGYGSSNKPLNSDQGYGNSDNNRPSYGGSQNANNKPYQSSSGYGSDSHPSYGENSQSTYNKPYAGESAGSQGYGSSSQIDFSNSYGSSEKPHKKPHGGSTSSSNKPYSDGYQSSNGYDSNQFYGSQLASNKPSYGSGQSSNNRPYGSNQGYGGQSSNDNYDSYGGQSYNKPYDGQSYSKPYGGQGYNDQSGYGSSHASHASHSSGYGSSASDGDQTYNSGYNERPSYGDDRPINSQSSYNSQHNSQHASQSTYESSSGYNRPTESGGYQKPGNQSNYRPGYDPNRPDVRPVYEYETDRPDDVPSYIAKPNGDIITSRPVAVGDYGGKPGYGRIPDETSYKACFRRVLAGKRTLRSHVRRVVNCERLEDCQRECAIERRFHCESFNYRLDPSFRGKGLCELMTKPIEAFDLRRDFVDDKDYDFYELDRNSLEPNCPDTLRGPGLLHSGFLSNKRPQDVDRWKDRIDWYDRSSQSEYERYYNERRGTYNSNRRYQNQVFVPYQIGVINRSDEDSEAWRKHGGSYGGYNYYKDKTDYRKSIDHWRISDESRRSDYYGVTSHGHNTDFNYDSLGKNSGLDNYGYGYGAWRKGGWNSSWNGLEYESSHVKYGKPQYYYESTDRQDGPPVKDCSSRRRPGMSLGSGAIRRSLFARNVVECEAACFGEKEFKCVSYSYKYSSGRGSDNCFLSERPYRGLDMSADSDSDVYAMPQDQGCATISRKPWVESECFWHVRSDAAVGGIAASASLSVTGLGACEAECIRAHAFFCRGFSFRFDSPTIGDDLENCILTSSPPTSLEIGRGLRPTAGHELYARGNYGRGCEPALYDDVQNRETECYLQYDSAAKLKGSSVRGQARVKDERECGRACTDAPFRCLSFSFNNNARPGVDNCLLSEIRLFDLQRGVDYEHSVDDWLFAFDLFNGRCWRKVHGKQEYEAPSYELPRPLPPLESEYPVSGSSSLDISGPPEVHYPPSSGPSGPDFKPGYPSGPEPPVSKPSYTAPSGPSYKPGSPPGYLPDTGPSGPSGLDFKPGYIPSSPGYIEPTGPGFKPTPAFDVPSRPYKPIPSIPPRKPGYIPSGPSNQDYIPSYIPSSTGGSGYKPGYRPVEPNRPYPPLLPKPDYTPGQSKPGYDGELEDNVIASWRHYTVSGFPCRRGTTCAQNYVAGHWACEPEGGEIGSWDYCCAPTHRCGYSEGFQKPWCYVGPTHEQWRPCSEKYYPYYKHNVPHPSQGHGAKPSRPTGQWRDRTETVPLSSDRIPGPYLPEADRKYWDDLYRNGPQAYYDKNGNPLPGYTRVPTEERPRIKYRHNPPRPGSGTWVSVPELNDAGDHIPEPLGSPRYWPVAYLHKGPPPNMTYFRYNETEKVSEDKIQSRENEDSVLLPTELPRDELKKVDVAKPKVTDIEGRKIRDEPNNNTTNNYDNYLKIDVETTTTSTTTTMTPTTTTFIPSTTYKAEVQTTENSKNITSANITDVEMIDPGEKIHEYENIKGIDGKLEDFSKSIEVFNIEDVSKCDKLTNLKTLEAEERQIEAIGRLVASRRGGKLMLEKRSQKDLENENIAVDKDLLDFNFGNRFPTTERRGIVQRVSKDDIEKERYSNDKSLEVSETTFVRPPRVLSTTENIRKAVVNGKIFYDAMIREQRELFSNSTRKSKGLKLEEAKGPSVISNSSQTKRKTIRPRNTNPVKRIKRVYRKRYNPDEVRKRLLDREKNLKQSNNTELNKRS